MARGWAVWWVLGRRRGMYADGLDQEAATARIREAVRADQEAAAAQLRQAQVEEAAFIAGAEGEAVTWLRQWHALLARQLESHLAGLDSSNSVRKADELLENFPRGGEEYTQHLRAHMSLPITAPLNSDRSFRFQCRQPGLSGSGPCSKISSRESKPDQIARSAIIFLVSAIALAGLNPLGQTFAQFMIVWQR